MDQISQALPTGVAESREPWLNKCNLMVGFKAILAMGLSLTVSIAMSRPDEPFEEELMDLVIQQCQSGDNKQVQAISQAIRDQLSPPPEILALLAQIEQTNCLGPAQKPTDRPYTELAIAMGFDDNINLGIKADSITLGSASKPITFLLDSDYKPNSRAYLSASATRQFITDNGWTLQGSVGLRKINDYSPLDTVGYSRNGRYPLKPMGIASQVQIGWSQSWLGGTVYRQMPTLEWESTLGNPKQPWVITGQIDQPNYPTQSSQDARIALLSLTRYVRWEPLGLLSVGAGLINDQALKQRAGGNRQGQTIQASAQHDLPYGQIQAQWSQTRWISAQDFFTSLVDERRQNRTKQLTLTYQRKLSAQMSFYAQYQYRTAQDTVPLYVHTSNDLVAGWVQQWR
jgi:hypothetical protein